MPKPHPVAMACLRAYKPEPLMNLSDWSDRYRILSSKSSAEPGPWRTSRTPYLKEIMDCLSTSSEVEEVVFMKGSQIGGSECGICWLGYIVDHCPGPTMIVQPNDNLAKRFSKQRIDPLFNESPKIRGKVVSKRAKDARNTTLLKDFEGGFMIISGAQSASGLKSTPIRNLFLDEIDSYVEDADGEGDPVKLAEARTRTFGSRKKFKVSSPTLEGRSRIEKEFNKTDQRKYHVPCPGCGSFQTLIWAQIKWPKDEPHNAYYECQHCHFQIQEWMKGDMLAKGHWVATNLEHKNKKIAGFHLSALYSPVGWYSWANCAQQFLEAKKDPLELMVFVNTILGETWKEQGDAPDWEEIYRRREDYRIGSIPDGVLFLTAGADVQKDRIELEIVGWGRDGQSWSIDYTEISGDTSTDEPYKELDSVLTQTFPFASNPEARLPIKILAIDSGYNTQTVYNWSRKHPSQVMAVKGFQTQPVIISGGKFVDVNYQGKTHRNGVRLWTVGTNISKTQLYGWLKLKAPLNSEPFRPYYCHFPMYSEGFFKSLTAEQLRVRRVRGHPVYEWHKVYERNEALDARIYARAAASIVGLDRFDNHNWDELEKIIVELKTQETVDNKKVKIETKGGIPIRKSKFWGDR